MAPISTSLRRRASPRSPSTSMVSKARLTCCWSLRDGSGSTWRAFPSWRSPSNICCFVEAARKLRLELAADYLVMAAWLAFLKSRLLLPAPAEPAELDAPALAEGLAQRLRALAAIRKAGEHLMSRPRLGRDFFARGEPEAAVNTSGRISYQANLYDLLAAYARQSSAPCAGARPLQDARGLVARRGAPGPDPPGWRPSRLDGFRQFSPGGVRRSRHAPERARVHFRGVARTRARRQNRNAPGEGLRADLASPDGYQSWRRARSMTFALPPAIEAAPFAPTAERAIREPSRAPSSGRVRSCLINRNSRKALHGPYDRRG